VPVAASAVAGLDLDALRRFLDELALIDPAAPLAAELIHGGKSNLTYRVAAGDRTLIVRRPPLGSRQPTAHSMRREYSVMKALAASDVPVPRVLAIAEAGTVADTALYVMDEVPGRVFRDVADASALDRGEAQALGRTLVRTLATLHRCDYEALGLGDLGRPDGFMRRQVTRWTEQWQQIRAREIRDLDALAGRLAARIPEPSRAAIVHGDYRVDNVIVDTRDAGRIAAVVDWEMATLGDPLADLGMLVMYWGRPGEPHPSGVHAITALPGFPTRDEVVALYAEASGIDVAELGFYVAFAHFKLAVIVEGIVTRHRRGETVGEGFDELVRIPPVLAARGLEQALT
jgi:aminoglycoside phosphotransferase (APT) family kinase protein